MSVAEHMTIATINEGNVAHLVVANNPCSLRNAAKMDFEAHPDYVNFQSNKKLLESHEDRLRNLAIASRLAMIVLSQSKTEMVDWLKSMDEEGGGEAAEALGDQIVHGAEMAKLLTDFLQSARAQLTVAMTCTVPDEALED